MRTRSDLPRDFARHASVLLIDCEFTCWEHSRRSHWSDPGRPPELIEIGLAHYDLRRDAVGETFTSCVRPRLNPRLSRYCRDLTHIEQAEIDAAPPLPDVLGRAEAWLSTHQLQSLPVCEWGTGDLPFIAQDAARHGCSSPLREVRHVALRRLYERLVDHDTFGDGERDTIRRHFGLAPNPGRHRALCDALDLATFCRHLKRLAPNP